MAHAIVGRLAIATGYASNIVAARPQRHSRKAPFKDGRTTIVHLGQPKEASCGGPTMLVPLTLPRNSWPSRVGIAVASQGIALVATHAFWSQLQHTPFLLGFAAAVLSSRVGGRTSGFLAVIIGALGFASFPPPSHAAGLGPALIGFVIISSAFVWLAARRDEIEAALRSSKAIVNRSERRLQAIIDAEPACVMLISPDGTLLEMNRAGLEMTGADGVAQLVGRPIVDLVHPDDRGRFLEMHRVVSSGSPGVMEFRLVGFKGDERCVDAHAVPFDMLTDTGERQRAVLSVASDITARKGLEDQLRQSQKMEAIGMLAGGIAHDFNNLLTAIGGYTEMVLETLDEPDPRRKDLQEVSKAAQRAAALTRQLLAVSRRQILQPTVLDVNGMVGDVQKLLRHTIPESIDLQLALGTVDPVRADRGQLEQVVLNLAINAGDAMPQGGRLRLSTASVDVDHDWAQRHASMTAGRYVRLTVSDTGVGMTPETKARIFEPFFTTKERGKGTGLGLATVYGIVKQSEGFIWVTSEVGRGTTFDIYLPAVREPVAHTVPHPAVVEVHGGTQTILLAEDDGAVRRLARDVLTNQGYTVLDARDGDEALEIARQYGGPIHLLIADVVMPGLSGRELSEQLNLARPGSPVLYTSGYTENLMVRAGFEQGLTLLAKPFLPADLLRKVDEVLRVRRIEAL
ncbi:MAG TPA: ATP-binding protein [Vicinamibacterales bacterium]|nr:ATP-binding protein [Vicinamibacterales bacterium]